MGGIGFGSISPVLAAMRETGKLGEYYMAIANVRHQRQYLAC